MKVQNSNEPLKNLDEQIRKKINNKENELEQIGKLYEKKITIANSEGDQRVVETVDKNNKRLIDANKEYEEKLKSYQDSLALTHSNVAEEELKAIETSKAMKYNLRNQSEDQYSKIYENAKNNQENIFNKAQNDSKVLEVKARHDHNLQESRTRQDLTNYTNNLTQSTREQEENLKKQLESEQAVMAHTLIQNKMDTQARLIDSKDKGRRLEAEQTRVQTDQMKFQDQYHAELMRTKQADFKQRYEKMAQEHDVILNNLKAKLDKSAKLAVENNARDIASIPDPSKDSFYQLEILKPKMTEDLKNYYVSLEVPEHEKENVHLMAHGREVKITLSKKFQNTITAPDGSENHVSKTQLYSKEFPTTEILNPKHISQKYENGILNFKVAKL